MASHVLCVFDPLEPIKSNPLLTLIKIAGIMSVFLAEYFLIYASYLWMYDRNLLD